MIIGSQSEMGLIEAFVFYISIVILSLIFNLINYWFLNLSNKITKLIVELL